VRCFAWPLARLLDGHLGQVADDGVHVLAHIAHLGELGGLDLDEGRIGQRARRRAISVLPTPVGPIIRMFLGVISARSFSSTCWRRQRLRSAMATARLAPAGRRCGGRVRRRSPGGHGHGGVRNPQSGLWPGRGKRNSYFGSIYRSRWCGSCWCRCTARRRSPATS
jgi:hypothetical protein